MPRIAWPCSAVGSVGAGGTCGDKGTPPKLAEIDAKSINYIGAGTPESNAIP